MSEPLPPQARDPKHPFVASPFTRLARTHAFSVGGDALFAVGLAGSVFFSVDPAEARWKIGLYLLLTFAPFAVAAPFIGPVLDRVRGGRRWMIAITLAIRAVLCVLIVRDLNSVAFYFEAFLMLVFSKTYLISRAAVVPTTVRSDRELVEANSKLALLSGMAAIVAGGPGLLLLKIGGDQHGPQLAVGVGAIVFAIGVGFATRLPKVQVAPEPAGAAEKQELRSAGIRLAASAMALLRCAVGLLVLMVAFAFKNGDLPTWTLAGAVVAAQAGVLAGAGLAPRLRLAFTEPRIIIGSLGATMFGGIVAAVLAGPAGAMLLCFLMGTTSGTAKQAFDALVQRDAPDANRGRSFARFETKFQLAWVLGAAMPLILPFPLIVGYAIIGGAMAVGMVSYWFGQRRVAKGTYDWESPSRKLVRRGLRKVDASLAPKVPGEAPVDPTELHDRARGGAGRRSQRVRPPWRPRPRLGAAGRVRVARAQRPDHRGVGAPAAPSAAPGPGAVRCRHRARSRPVRRRRRAGGSSPYRRADEPVAAPARAAADVAARLHRSGHGPDHLHRAPLARLAELAELTVSRWADRAGRCGPATGRGRRPRPGWAGSARRTTGARGPRRRPARPRRPRSASRGRTGSG